MDRGALIADLARHEPDAVIRTMAMMAYNPAIGRVLGEGGVRLFEDLMVEAIPMMKAATTRAAFDEFHSNACDRIRAALKTNKGESLSYGQAQKPMNVFLKVYVAWSRLPDPSTAGILTPWLHVPLDSVVMNFVKDAFPGEYQEHVVNVCAPYVSQIAADQPSLSKRKINSMLIETVALAWIQKPVYLAWQEMLRRLHPDCPILLDTIWALERGRTVSV